MDKTEPGNIPRNLAGQGRQLNTLFGTLTVR